MKTNSVTFFPTTLFFCGILTLVSQTASAESLTALGRVLPQSGIVDIVGTEGDTVTAILVKEGEWVEAGQPLATLSSAKAAEKRLADAVADLASVKARVATDIEIAQTSIKNAQVELNFAKERYDRTDAAKNSEFISPDQLEDKTVAKEDATMKLMQAQEKLANVNNDSNKSIRGAEADVAAAKAILAMAQVHSPIKARVLKTIAHVGTTVGRSALFKIGDTSSMVVMAEVYQDDALKVKVGQKAVVSSVALPSKMTGVVSSVSAMIYRNSLESLDPNDNAQTRIIEVTIKMDNVEPLDRLVMLQADVTIAL